MREEDKAFYEKLLNSFAAWEDTLPHPKIVKANIHTPFRSNQMRDKRSVMRRDQICICGTKTVIDLRDLNGLNAIQRYYSVSTTAVPPTEQHFYLWRRGDQVLTSPPPHTHPAGSHFASHTVPGIPQSTVGGGTVQWGAGWEVAFLKHNSIYASKDLSQYF